MVLQHALTNPSEWLICLKCASQNKPKGLDNFPKLFYFFLKIGVVFALYAHSLTRIDIASSVHHQQWGPGVPFTSLGWPRQRQLLSCEDLWLTAVRLNPAKKWWWWFTGERLTSAGEKVRLSVCSWVNPERPAELSGSHDWDHTRLAGRHSGTAVLFITLLNSRGTTSINVPAGRLKQLCLISEAILVEVDFLFL